MDGSGSIQKITALDSEHWIIVYDDPKIEAKDRIAKLATGNKNNVLLPLRQYEPNGAADGETAGRCPGKAHCQIRSYYS
jgi:hypothetical protein